MKAKKRLQKHSKPHDDESKTHEQYCKDLLDIFRAQTCLTLVENDKNIEGGREEKKNVNDVATGQAMETQASLSPTPPQPPPKHIEFRSQLSIIPNERENTSLTSIYPSEDFKMAAPPWRRAKTPVHAIGQLEKALQNHVISPEAADKLAEQYRAVLPLPPRTPTPLIVDTTQKRPRKTLRKIKCQQSLRDLVKSYPSTPISDCETLVDSDTSSSPPDSPVYKHVEVEPPIDFPLFESYDKQDIQRVLSPLSVGDTDISFQICMDLLTSKLATALFKQHPIDHADRVSGLQILLMIEAYESIKNRLQQEKEEEDQVTPAEEALDYWIEALYRIYDQTRTKENTEMDEQEDWPLPVTRLGSISEKTPEEEEEWSPHHQRHSTFTSTSSRDADDEAGMIRRNTLRHYAGIHA